MTDTRAEKGVNVFDFSGKFIVAFGKNKGKEDIGGIAVDCHGYVCVARPGGGFIDVYDPQHQWDCSFGQQGSGLGAGCSKMKSTDLA